MVEKDILRHVSECRECSRPLFTVRMYHLDRKGRLLRYVYTMAGREVDAIAEARRRVGMRIVPSRFNGAVDNVYSTERRKSDARLFLLK